MVKPSDLDPNDQPRLDDGTYTFRRRREAHAVLDLVGASTNPGYLDRILGSVERHNALVEGGYVEPIALSAVTDPRTRAKINEHWAQGIITAEHTEDGSGYPFPAVQNQQADGKRIARRAYQVDEWDMRFLGSAATVKRDAEAYGKHQVSVAIRRPDGGTVDAVVLVEKVGPGNYSVTPHSVNLGESGAAVAAAVQAVLEAKRVTQVPSHVGGLMDRARARAAATGVAPDTRLVSTWMDSVGYDDDQAMMVTKTSTGRLYGHTVPRSTFEAIRSSTKPGAIFNQLVKDKSKGAKPVSIETCGRCNRVYSLGRNHKCAAKPSVAPTTPQISNRISRQGAISVAAGALAMRRRIQARLDHQAQTPPTAQAT